MPSFKQPLGLDKKKNMASLFWDKTSACLFSYDQEKEVLMEVKGESRQMAQFNKLVGGSSVLQIYTMSAHHLKVVLLGRARENYI